MTRLEELDREIKLVGEDIDIMAAELTRLKAERRKLISVAYIAEHGITRDDVAMSSTDEVPWMNSIFNFADFLIRKRTQKTYLEWNGSIYPIADVAAGSVDWEGTARYEDVPE